MTTEDSF